MTKERCIWRGSFEPTPTFTPSVPEGESWKFYYYAGSNRIAMRLKNVYGEQVYYFFNDHLGSTNVITDPNGNVVSETMYKAWGEVRYSAGSMPTDYTYTGQRSDMDDLDLMFYNARWYDPQLGRFIQADTIVPGAGSPAAYDRYAYVVNDPIGFSDPLGRSCRRMLGPGQHSEEECGDAALSYYGEETKGERISSLIRIINSTTETKISTNLYGIDENPDTIINGLQAIISLDFYSRYGVMGNPITSSTASNLLMGIKTNVKESYVLNNTISIIDFLQATDRIKVTGSAAKLIPVVGMFAAGWVQWDDDSTLGLDFTEHFGRALIKGFEDLGADAILTPVCSSMMAVGPQVWPIVGINYIGMSYALDAQADNFNQEYVFPVYKEFLDNFR